MNKKLFISLLMIGVMAFGAGLGTYAWFTSSAVSTANEFTTGTLTLGINGETDGEYTLDLGTINNMAPGDVTDSVSIIIENKGTLDLGWFGRFFVSSATDNAKLAEALYVKEAQMEFLNPTTGKWEPTDKFITNGDGSGLYPSAYEAMADRDPFKVISLKTLLGDNTMGAGGGVMKGALRPTYKYKFTFQLGMAPLADNNYQGNKIEKLNLSYRVDATQVNLEALKALDTERQYISVADANENFGWMEDQLEKQGIVNLE